MSNEILLRLRRVGDLGWEAAGSEIAATGLDVKTAMDGWWKQAEARGLFAVDETPILPPLRLRWPVPQYLVYTQPFGARQEYYAQFNLSGGHEGVDIRAPHGTPVYSACSGLVYKVGLRYYPDQREHVYGYQIRVRRRFLDGDYELIYAHLVDGSAEVHEGEHVAVGDLLALADNTGNSGGAHLHLTLKKLKRPGETKAAPPMMPGVKWYYLPDGAIVVDPSPLFLDGPKF